VARFVLAVDRPFNRDGKRETDFIDVEVWRKLAETCAEHISKGRLVAVEGAIRVQNYKDKDGRSRKAVRVVADNVKFLDRGKKQEKQDGFVDAEVNLPEDEIPF
jgi:single-strand DNA-binding protein